MGVTQKDSECPGVSGTLGQPNTNLVAQDPRRFQVKLIPRRHHAAATEIRCQFIILARKDEPTSRQEARERCVGLSAISSLLQKGDSRVMSLGHPSYPRPKGTRNHSMAEKRGYVEIGETGPRKTRVAWSKLDRLNPNPDRGLSYSVVRPIEHDVIECRPFPFRGYGKPAR